MTRETMRRLVRDCLSSEPPSHCCEFADASGRNCNVCGRSDDVPPEELEKVRRVIGRVLERAAATQGSGEEGGDGMSLAEELCILRDSPESIVQVHRGCLRSMAGQAILLERRLQQSEAETTEIRAALMWLYRLYANGVYNLPDEHFAAIANAATALSTDAGKAMLERMKRLEAVAAALKAALERTVDALSNGLEYGAHKADDYDQAQVRRVCKNAAAALSAAALSADAGAAMLERMRRLEAVAAAAKRLHGDIDYAGLLDVDEWNQDNYLAMQSVSDSHIHLTDALAALEEVTPSDLPARPTT